MYKTVRRGDAVLQYRVLGSATPPVQRTPRRTAFLLLLTLILGCGVVVAAVLLPGLLRLHTLSLAPLPLQGRHLIALLPVKDSPGRFNAYQINPHPVFPTIHPHHHRPPQESTTTTTTTTLPTTTVPPTTTRVPPHIPAAPVAAAAVENAVPDTAALLSNNRINRTSRIVGDRPWFRPETPFKSELASTDSIAVTDSFTRWTWYGVGSMLSAVTLGVCFLIWRRTRSRRKRINMLTDIRNDDKGTLLSEVSCEED
ncbi:hypothetical protein LSTR_LSTR005148 [Laodelphax striatellus]|uniref:Uncharacterized protein n=1 Tax=Laodelphax striatellus TaxID=195883 RepID=A0A482WRF9_LAOST|nr:hypothetical protein LSTR_LSTR005148 [Laodelphax striatellus]